MENNEEKIWYILVNDEAKGPYSLEELKKNRHLTLETYVWCQSFKDWVLVKEVPELRKLFIREKPSSKQKKNSSKKISFSKEDEVLALDSKPPDLFPYIVWILLFLVIIIYIIFNKLA